MNCPHHEGIVVTQDFMKKHISNIDSSLSSIDQNIRDMNLRLDRIEQSAIIRRRHLGYIWAAISVVGIEGVYVISRVIPPLQ